MISQSPGARERTRHLEKEINPLLKQMFILRVICNPKNLWKSSKLTLEGTTNLMYLGHCEANLTKPERCLSSQR